MLSRSAVARRRRRLAKLDDADRCQLWRRRASETSGQQDDVVPESSEGTEHGLKVVRGPLRAEGGTPGSLQT